MSESNSTLRRPDQARPPVALRRAPFPAWGRYLGYALVYGIGVPLTKLLESFGVWPRLVSRAMARQLGTSRGYEPTPQDVLICSYFKSGTNWTMQIALQVAHRGRAAYAHIHDLVPWLELPDDAGYAVPLHDDGARKSAPTGLRVIKTHLTFGDAESLVDASTEAARQSATARTGKPAAAFDDLVYTPTARYVWVVRDPKDVFVSSYHFVRATVLGPLMPSVQRWLDLFLSPDAPCGAWAPHVAGGWRNRHRDNVLFLTYEEMKAELELTVERIAKFMGVELTVDELARVVEQSSYAGMKAIGHKFDTVGISPPWAKPSGSMVRRGERGGADELLTRAEQRRIDDYCRAELARLGCDFPYDEVFSTVREETAAGMLLTT